MKLNGTSKITILNCIEDVAANMGNKVRKLVSVKEGEVVKSNQREYTKQEYVLSDQSRVCRFVVWEKLVNAVECGKCYEMTNINVKAYVWWTEIFVDNLMNRR